MRKVFSKKEGFPGQKLVVLSLALKKQLAEDSFVRHLYLTDIGIFPKAENHYVKREKGSSEYVLQICFEGDGFCEFNGHTSRIKAGQYFILPPGKKHIYGSYKNLSWKVGWIHLLGRDVTDIVSRINLNGFGKPHDFHVSETWQLLFEEVTNSLEQDLSYTNVAGKCSYLSPLLSEFIYRDRMDFSKSADPVEKAIKMMHMNVGNQLTLDSMASKAGLSVSRFSVVFKNKTGTSPNEYFLGIKMQKACHYLITSTMTVREISSHLAFDDPYYFSRCFKKRMGASPLHYRKTV